ncbi:MAG TPA: hypothetical protein VD704_11235 [Gaiellaceae bacterium]|nr:hypothetical protein [Gaiellaceae bacterium]
MSRWATWLVVGALAAVGVAAAVDALREGGGRPRPEAVRSTTAPLLARQPELAVRRLREAGVTGLLTFSDEGCRLHSLSLPELTAEPAPSYEMCRPLSAAGGLGAVDGDVVWSGLGYGTVQVVVTREALGRGVNRALGQAAAAEGAGFRAVQAVAIGDGRTVVLAESTYRPTERVLALLEGGRVRAVQPRWVVGDARFLRASPRGTFFAVFGPGGVRLFDRDAAPLGLPEGVADPHAVAWSPDERWTALAAGESVVLFPSEPPHVPVVNVPLAVRDLDWSG